MILREKDLLIQEHTARIFCFNISTSFLYVVFCTTLLYKIKDIGAMQLNDINLSGKSINYQYGSTLYGYKSRKSIYNNNHKKCLQT